MNCWTLKSKGADSSFGGNSGYADELGTHYVYDNNVKNYQRVKEGDIVIIAGKNDIFGIARIENIEIEYQVPGIRYRCPECTTQEFYERKNVSPRYKCRNKHEFDVPNEQHIFNDRYTASYGSSFSSLGIPVKTKELNPYFVNYNRYYSIQQTQLTFLTDNIPEAIRLLVARPEPALQITAVQDEPLPYIPDEEDKRKYEDRNVAVREGQTAFKNDLINYYGARCMLTDCTTKEVIDACHITPYRGRHTNLIANGLLLRKDLHTLYDKNLLGIHPETLTVTLHRSLKNSHYQEFEGKKLQPAANNCKSATHALEIRWLAFQDQDSR